MKVYEISIKLLSGFGTSLKGDTIFGHICWQCSYDEKLLGKSIGELLSDYNTNPFMVVSSAYPRVPRADGYYYALKTPDLPLDRIFSFSDSENEKIKKRKEYKSKKWMLIEKIESITAFNKLDYLDDKGLLDLYSNNHKQAHKVERGPDKGTNICLRISQSHNSINRITFTTGEDKFAPFSVDQFFFYPEMDFVFFVGINEKLISIKDVKNAISRLGALGFGKDASTGLGRFEICEEPVEIDWPLNIDSTTNALYTLGPCVPEKNEYAKFFFKPFVRYGKHGDALAKSGNPFKNPVIMADEGAVLKPLISGALEKPYIGTAVIGVSKIQPEAVMQGYSLCIAANLED